MNEDVKRDLHRLIDEIEDDNALNLLREEAITYAGKNSIADELTKEQIKELETTLTEVVSENSTYDELKNDRPAVLATDPSNTLFLEFKVSFLKWFYNFKDVVSNVHHPENLKMNIVNAQLSNILSLTERFKLDLSNGVKGVKGLVLQMHTETVTYLAEFRTLYYLLEKKNFFEQKVTKELSEQVLCNLYETEAMVRNVVYSNKDHNINDEKLNAFASHLSLNSL